MSTPEFANEAQWFADEYGLAPQRIADLLSRIFEAGTFARPPQEELLRASRDLGGARAVFLMEEANLFELGLKVTAYNRLASPLTPLVTLEELQSLTRQCVDFLKKQSSELLECGLPSELFRASAWHDWHLGRLLFVKRPVVIDGDDLVTTLTQAAIPPDAVATQRGERLDYWTRNRPRPPFRLELVTPDYFGITDTRLSRVPQEPFNLSFDVRRGLLDEDGSEVIYCDYEDAANIKGFTAQDIARIEGIRESLLQLRIRCLEILLGAIEKGTASRIWPECVAVLTSSLSEQQVDGLLDIERRYGGWPSDWPHLWMLGRHAFFDNCAGFSDLIEVIGHVDSEITVGRHARLCEEFGEEVEMLEAESYYQCCDEDDVERLDRMLREEMELSLKESQYLKQQERSLEDLWPEFPAELHTSIKVPQDHAERASRFLDGAGDFAVVRIAAGEPLPDVGREMVRRDEGTADYVFRKERDTWRVVFEGSEELIRDLKGMGYIQELLRRPNEEITAMKLSAGPHQPDELYSSMSKDRLREERLQVTDIDADTRRPERRTTPDPWRERIEELEGELASAEAAGDPQLVLEKREELNNIKTEYSRHYDRHGRERQSEQQSEKARQAVKKAIDLAMEQLSERIRQHLSATIKTGRKCCYAPGRGDAIDWDLG